MGKFPGWLARLYPGIVVPEDFPLLEYPYNVLLPPHFTFTRVDEVHEPHDQMWHKVQEFKKEVDEKLDELYNFDNIIVLYSRLGEFHGSQRKRYGFDENDNLEDPRFFSVSGSESGIRAHWSQIFDVIKAVRQNHDEILSRLPVRFYFSRLDHDTKRLWNMENRCKGPRLIDESEESSSSTS